MVETRVDKKENLHKKKKRKDGDSTVCGGALYSGSSHAGASGWKSKPVGTRCTYALAFTCSIGRPKVTSIHTHTHAKGGACCYVVFGYTWRRTRVVAWSSGFSRRCPWQPSANPQGFSFFYFLDNNHNVLVRFFYQPKRKKHSFSYVVCSTGSFTF